MRNSYQISKGVFDYLFACLALLLLFPLLIFIFFIVRVDSGSPAIFLGRRVGLNGKYFSIIKYRTMVHNAENLYGGNVTSDDDPRITRVGKILRRYKLDELPQLINILKGDMSFVGPRPEVEEYVDLYSKEDKRIILSVKPGITDLSSLEFVQLGKELGKNNNEKQFQKQIEEILEKKILLRKKYIENMSLSLDFKIILKTLLKILK